MAHYAIVGIKKLHTAGNIAGTLEHMTRQRYTPNSNGRPNDILIPPPPLPELMEEINSYMPRSNCVICYEMLLTMSSGWLQGKSEKDIQEWERKSLEWVCKKFPPGAVKSCICHRDESVPHLTLLVLPVDPSGEKLNARFYTGGRAKLRQIWTEYAAAMKPLGLERGREYSPAKHQDIKAYYEAVNKGAKLAKVREIKPEELPPPELLDRVNPRQYAADLINRVTSFIRKENGALRAALAAEREKGEKITQQVINDREMFHALKENPDTFRKLQEALAAEAKARAGTEARYMELVQAIGQYFRQNVPHNSTLRHPDKLGHLQDFPELYDTIRLSLTPDIPARRGMERTR